MGGPAVYRGSLTTLAVELGFGIPQEHGWRILYGYSIDHLPFLYFFDTLFLSLPTHLLHLSAS